MCVITDWITVSGKKSQLRGNAEYKFLSFPLFLCQKIVQIKNRTQQGLRMILRNQEIVPEWRTCEASTNKTKTYSNGELSQEVSGKMCFYDAGELARESPTAFSE